MKREFDDRWDEATDRLIELTERRELEWEDVELPKRPLMDGFVGPQHVAEIEGRRVAVYEKSYKVYDGENDRFHPSTSVIIEFVDEKLGPGWVWPVRTWKRSELLDAIRNRWADGDGFLRTLLGTASE